MSAAMLLQVVGLMHGLWLCFACASLLSRLWVIHWPCSCEERENCSGTCIRSEKSWHFNWAKTPCCGYREEDDGLPTSWSNSSMVRALTKRAGEQTFSQAYPDGAWICLNYIFQQSALTTVWARCYPSLSPTLLLKLSYWAARNKPCMGPGTVDKYKLEDIWFGEMGAAVGNRVLASSL